MQTSLISNAVQSRPLKDQRRGLAPLEMALVLPLLMLFMAAIIAFGFAASWKMRSDVVARDLAWRSRHPRYANFESRAKEWPEPGTLERFPGTNLTTFDNDDILHAPIIRGEIPHVNVNHDLLDFSRDVVIGRASISRSPPILPRMGRMNFATEHPLLDTNFQYGPMGISNRSRRIPIIYEIDLDFIRGSSSFQATVSAILNSVDRHLLAALENDPEFIEWYGRAPDFHPRVSTRNYDLNPSVVRRGQVTSLMSAIDRLPQTMVQATISLYQEQLDHEPPLAASTQQALENKIEELREYLRLLRDR
jgi:hypothetical protein